MEKDRPPRSGYVKFRGDVGRHNVACIMSDIYGTNSKLHVVGKLHADGDWRKYDMITNDDKGFHYLMVQLNSAEKQTARTKHKYREDYGWVIYEYPGIMYKFDKEKKLVTDKTKPTVQLKVYSKHHEYAEHLPKGSAYH